MRIEQTFSIARPPEVVFDEMTDPAKLATWQTSKTSVHQLTPGPPGLGTRVRERTKPRGAREFEQLVEFTEFDRPRRLTVHVVEGPQPIDGRWSLQPDGGGTRVDFVADGDLRGAWRLLSPIVARAIDRQFRGYHDTLRRNLEGSA